jgi:AP-1 complex subunit gamma-1
MEIFGGSSESNALATVSPTPPKQKQTDDILSLFGANASAPVSERSGPPTIAANPLLATSVQETAIASPTQPQAYPAYDRNGLKITLTPQTSPAHPGMVNVMARFQVSGGKAASAMNFQAAVPKVSNECRRFV